MGHDAEAIMADIAEQEAKWARSEASLTNRLMDKEQLRQAFYAVSPFDLASGEDDLYRDAINDVLGQWHYIDATVEVTNKII